MRFTIPFIQVGAVVLITVFGGRARGAEPVPVVTGAKGVVAIHNSIEVGVDGLAAWEHANAGKNDPGKIVLFLNGMPLKGIAPRLDPTSPLADGSAPPELSADQATALETLRTKQRTDVEDKTMQGLLRQQAAREKWEHGKLLFDLELVSSEPDNLAAWNRLLSRPTISDLNGAVSTARVALGYESQLFPASADVFVKVKKLDRWGVLSAIVLVIALIWGMFELAARSNLLRDSGPPPPTGKQTFSLGRSQMAFWFVLVIVSYVSIWMMTGAVDTLTASVLELIGISSATGFAGVLVDGGKRQGASDKIASLRKQKQDLLKTDEENMISATDPRKAQVADLNAQIKALQEQAVVSPSAGFVQDILSDGDGVSLYRLQIAVWTIVAGVIFVASVYGTLSMPKLPDTLIGLMGLSSGAYIGFKLPSKA